jgi:hypothetical protein
MKITGTISDYRSGEALDGASVVVVDESGKQLGPGTTAKEDGSVEFSSDLLDVAGNKVQISQVGYDTMTVSPQSFGDIELTREGDSLDAVVFVKHIARKVKKSKYTVPIVMGSTSLALFAWAIVKKMSVH